MPVLENVKVSAGAWVSFSTLPTADREQILATLAGLSTQAPEQWPKEKVQRLTTEQPLYTFRYLLQPDDELFVTFRRDEGGELILVDLSLKDMIRRYFSGKKP